MPVNDRILYEKDPLGVGRFASNTGRDSADSRESGSSTDIPFGVFVAVDNTDKVSLLGASATKAAGVTMQSNRASELSSTDFTPEEYKQGDMVAYAYGGDVVVELDPTDANQPANVNTVIRISTATATSGFVTTNATGSRSITRGVKLISLDTDNDRCVVRLDGEIVLGA